MATKRTQSRIVVPKDIWDSVKFDDFEEKDFGFFITDDSRVIITHMSVAEKIHEYEFIGKCNFETKHRFVIPKNVDDYLGSDGRKYYFSASLSKRIIYIYKLDSSILQKRQSLQLQALLASL